MERIGKYHIVDELGRGGMGMVYKGRDMIIGRDVAVKVIQERALSDPAIKKRFYREARSAGRLSHENVTVIYDVGEEEGMPFLVMEYLEGDDLHTLLLQDTPLSTADKLAIAAQICSGLYYAHQQDIVHRDIKPANIRVLPNGRVKIMDFGIARIQSETQALTQTNLSLGTPRYMSPEQIKGEELDHRTDIFSFGVLFYELLTDTNPFDADHVTAIIYKILNSEPQPIAIVPDSLRADLQPIIDKCLAKDPDERYQDFSAVLADLHTVSIDDDETVLVSAETLAAARAVTQSTRYRPPGGTRPAAPASPATETVSPSSRKGLWIALAVVLALVVAGGGYVAFGPSPASDKPTTTLTQGPVAPMVTSPLLTSDTLDTTASDADALPHPDDTTTDAEVEDHVAAARRTADQERTRMEAARQRVADRRDDTAVAALFHQADQTRTNALQQYEEHHFEMAAGTFRVARSIYGQIEQTPAAQPEAPDEQPTVTQPPPVAETPSSTGNQADADRAQTTMETAKNTVSAAQRQAPSYQQGLTQESQGRAAYADRAYDRAAAAFEEARALFAEAASQPTPGEQATAAIQTLTTQLKRAFEARDMARLRAVHQFYNSFEDFVQRASSITATITPGSVQLSGDEATVTVSIALDFTLDRGQRQNAQFSHAWTLSAQNNQWTLAQVAVR